MADRHQDEEATMIQHNPGALFPPYRCYSHAIEIPAGSRLLVISGLNGYLADGTTMPDSFDEQGDVIWTHLRTILQAAHMDYTDLVSLRTYLADPGYDEANVRLRMKYLGTHRPASTVVCCRLLDPRWKLEIEAMAAK
jgi:2-iminobutanoate/2-iminopropanoate deaminase